MKVNVESVTGKSRVDRLVWTRDKMWRFACDEESIREDSNIIILEGGAVRRFQCLVR